MSLQQFDKEYTVHIYELGPDEKINLWSLFNFMQDIAAEHAIKLGYGRDDLMKKNHFWVLSRMYAVIRDWPELKDTVMVRTWPSGTEKMFAMRNYELRYPDGSPVAFGSSSWLIVDRTSKKIQRPDEFLTRYSPDNQTIIPPVRNAVKLAGISSGALLSPGFRVKTSDLDANMHANNVKYLEWVCETYSLDFIMTHLPCSAEINYLAESVFDDEIIIRTSKDETDDRFFSHSIFRAGDNRELCRIRLEWIEKTTTGNRLQA